ncbi:P-loop containing nucleoside triphosphate hydrolase protein [Rhodocollybia butyracea]|uniref:P-loop containing nucleoside triphosphate hydrolase protein n=1 Tax=Rhodocollybia butyracea TaxID=206335 RepID=A0A9P5Q0E4_9AGAR|nr:P-loop containing nucleoside triphosphate hydrolase protein [Rhodocollybia butyracea]
MPTQHRTTVPQRPLRTIKLVVIGASGVGKTSLRGQYISNRFSTGYRATIGADFVTKVVRVDEGESVVLQIWDTAGQERFSSLSSAFFRGADAAILAFDASNLDETLGALKKWWEEFKVYAPVDEESRNGSRSIATFCVALVGNKVDLIQGEGRVRKHEQARRFMDILVPPELYEEAELESDEEEEEDILAASQLTARPTAHQMLKTPSPPAKSKFIGHSSSSRSLYTSSSISGLSIYHTPSSSVYGSGSVRTSSPLRRSLDDLAWIGSYPPRLGSIASLESGQASAVTLTPTNWDTFKHDEGNRRTRYASINSVSSSVSAAESFYSAFSTRDSSHLSPQLSPSGTFHSRVRTRSLSPSPKPNSDLPSRPDSKQISPPTQLHSTLVPTKLQLQSPKPPKPPKLDTGPRLFFASAKSGQGVPEVFEYIAKRVVRRWEWEESVEAETMLEWDVNRGVGKPHQAQNGHAGGGSVHVISNAHGGVDQSIASRIGIGQAQSGVVNLMGTVSSMFGTSGASGAGSCCP